MSWTDKKAMEHIRLLSRLFNVKTFVETGTFKGINVRAHKDNFERILSCEKEYDYFRIAMGKNSDSPNIKITNEDSIDFLKRLRYMYPDENKIFYLDAHFYDQIKPKGKGKFVVLDELKALSKLEKAIIIIHDFDNNLGHITYDGISLDMDLLREPLKSVNPKFGFYTNELSSCEIMKPDETQDKDMRENLAYAWSKPEKTYRGILYCTPQLVDINGLKRIK